VVLLIEQDRKKCLAEGCHYISFMGQFNKACAALRCYFAGLFKSVNSGYFFNELREIIKALNRTITVP
jgi:hypothetical protein